MVGFKKWQLASFEKEVSGVTTGDGNYIFATGKAVHQLPLKVFRPRYALCFVEGYELGPAELEEMLVHGPQAIFIAASFEMGLDLVETVLPDARLDGKSPRCCIDSTFGSRDGMRPQYFLHSFEAGDSLPHLRGNGNHFLTMEYDMARDMLFTQVNIAGKTPRQFFRIGFISLSKAAPTE